MPLTLTKIYTIKKNSIPCSLKLDFKVIVRTKMVSAIFRCLFTFIYNIYIYMD